VIILNYRKIRKITVLAILLFLSSTILIAAKTNISFSNPLGDMELAATSTTTMVYVDPPSVNKSVGETFTIDVVVADVADLYGVDIQFQWDPSILEYVNHTAHITKDNYADGILYEPGMFIMDNVDEAAGTYWISYACMDPAPAFNGTGTVFNMTFTVKKAGGCLLEFLKDPRSLLPLIQLSNKAGWSISYDWQDGYFETPGIPTASFTWQPQIGVVGKPTSFNASESFTPSGTIVMYYWDFADGNTTASTSAEITHAFNHTVFTKTYSVSLKVEDDAGVKSSLTVEQVTIVKSRNIEIMSIALSSTKKRVNSTIQANASVTNDGYANESFTLAAYYNTSATEWTMIATTNVVNLSRTTKEYCFIWNTTGVEADKHYLIKVNATTVPYEDETDNTMISEPVYITSEAIHDLAVETFRLQASYGGDKFAVPVILGESALFTIGIENHGSVPEESYCVVVYSNGSLLNDWSITDALDAGAANTLTYTWNNISQRGRYNITAQVTITPDDNNTQNNQLQQMMHVIGKPILNITYTPETLVVNQVIVLNASSSVHGDPDGQITSYYWAIYAPGQELEEIPKYQSAESEISTSYEFTEAGNWTIVLRVKDNYGITYSGTRSQTGVYKLTEKMLVQGGGWGLIEYIAVIIVVAVAAIAAFVLIRRRRSGLTPTE